MDESFTYYLIPAMVLMLVGFSLIRRESAAAKRWASLAFFATIVVMAIGVLVPLVVAAAENPLPSLIPIAFVVTMVCLFGYSTLLRLRPSKDEGRAKLEAKLDYRLTMTFVYGILIFGAGWFVYMLGEWFAPADPTMRWTISAIGALVLIGLVIPMGILSSRRRREERVAQARSVPLPDEEADRLFARALDAELAGEGIRRSTIMVSVAAAILIIVSAVIAFWLPAQLEQIPDTSPAPWATGVILGIGIGLAAIFLIAVLYGPFLYGSIASYRRAFLSDSEWRAAEDRMLNRH